MKTRKFGIIFALLSALILLCTLPCAAEEQDGLSYSVANGEARIYQVSPTLSGHLTIPEQLGGYPVTSIGMYAFYRNTTLTGVTLPSTLLTIENAAFSGCTALETIEIPDHVKSLGESVFEQCTGLKSFSLPSTLTALPARIFSGCTALEVIRLPESLQKIGTGAFSGCSGAKEIYIPKSVTEIGYVAFDRCDAVEKLTIPFLGETPSDSGAILGDTFTTTNRNLPATLKEVVLLGGTRIEEDAFEDCASMESISLPASVTSIADNAFSGCASLKKITVDGANSTYQGIGNCLIHRQTKRLILGCAASAIPEDGSVTVIGAYAFAGATGLKRIVVPNSVKKIERYAFFGCTALEEISLPFIGEQASGANSHFGYIFGAHSIESHNQTILPPSLKSVTVTGSCSIAAGAFTSCRDITSFTATASISRVYEFAFSHCSSLKSVRFEGKTDAINQSAFLNCTALREIHLPSSVGSIGKGIFEGCPSVKMYCVSGSVAEQYAIRNRIPYEATGTPVVTTPITTAKPEPEPQTKPVTTAKPDPIPQTKPVTTAKPDPVPQTKPITTTKPDPEPQTRPGTTSSPDTPPTTSAPAQSVTPSVTDDEPDDAPSSDRSDTAAPSSEPTGCGSMMETLGVMLMLVCTTALLHRRKE